MARAASFLECPVRTCPGTWSQTELPASVAADRHRHRLVARRVESLQDGARRRERDLVLARPAAREHRDPDAPTHGTAVVVVVAVVSVVVSAGGGAL